MSGRIQSYRKTKPSPRVKQAGSALNPHRARANAQKQRNVAASAAKAAAVAKRRAKKAAKKAA